MGACKKTGQHYIVSKWRKYIITRDPIKRFEVKEIKIKEDGDGFIMPEIALAGRSNVGKSTLLNALLYSNIPVEKLEEDNNYQYKYNEAYHNSKYNNINRNAIMPGTRKKKLKLKLSKGAKAVISPKPGE